MPAHVVERVRADYQKRLDAVATDLQAQAGSMRSEASTLEERVRSLASDLAAKRDARAEDELRALVGEYSEEEWSSKAAEHDAGIHALESERQEHETEHNRLQQLLTDAIRAPRPSTPISTAVIAAFEDIKTDVDVQPAAPVQPEPEPAPPVVASTPAAVASPDPADAEPAEPPAPKRPSPFDEIGFMRAVVGRTTPFPGIEPPKLEDLAPRSPTPARDAKGVTARPFAQTPVPAPEPVQPPPSPPSKPVPSFEAPPIPDAPIVAPLRASSPAIPMITDESSIADSMRASTSMPDAARTLKCQECGWMNYPTEWYCEKCGGELAAF